MNTIEKMQERLAQLAPTRIEIEDESAWHAGHEGAKSGGGHYQLRIVSPRFEGQSTLARHRIVYDSLRDMMQKEIHALSIKAYTPTEDRSGSPG
ncbi:MAG: BolA family transcriptional regulator [Betaproteobacteria bacterium]|nr:BolA family transcriptional regulator [Betaproteobacteria bacterium]